MYTNVKNAYLKYIEEICFLNYDEIMLKIILEAVQFM